MYIDILLALAFIISTYFLWRRISDKIPELIVTPDEDLSVLLEENTAKFQLFFLHLFHFRSFYRERHYHEKVRLTMTKLLYRAHIAILRLDNGIIRMMKRMREGNESAVQQEVSINEYTVPVQEEKQFVSEKINVVQEVRSRRRVSFVNVLGSRKTNAAKGTFANDRVLPRP